MKRINAPRPSRGQKPRGRLSCCSPFCGIYEPPENYLGAKPAPDGGDQSAGTISQSHRFHLHAGKFLSVFKRRAFRCRTIFCIVSENHSRGNSSPCPASDVWELHFRAISRGAVFSSSSSPSISSSGLHLCPSRVLGYSTSR